MSNKSVKKHNYLPPAKTWQDDSKTLINQREMMLHDDFGNDYAVNVFGKRIYGQKQFWKCYLMDFLSILGILESKQLDVLIYILENAKPSDNIFIGTYDSIQEGAKVSRPTVAKIMKKLMEVHFLKRIQAGVYMVNPALMMKGNEKKKQIMIQYFQEDGCENSDVVDSPALPKIDKDIADGQMNLENDFPEYLPNQKDGD